MFTLPAILRRKKMTLRVMRGALRVAKADGNDAAGAIYWADVFSSQMGIPNTVRSDIERDKPALQLAIEVSNGEVISIKALIEGKTKAINENTKKMVDWIRESVIAWLEKRAEKKIAKAATKAEKKIDRSKYISETAESDLAEIAEIEGMLSPVPAVAEK